MKILSVTFIENDERKTETAEQKKKRKKQEKSLGNK